MGAKDVFMNPQFQHPSLSSVQHASSLLLIADKCGTLQKREKKRNSSTNTHSDCATPNNNTIDEEWHQKYAYIIGLLRKPHYLLVRESLMREREKCTDKLNAYRLERKLLHQSLTRHDKETR